MSALCVKHHQLKALSPNAQIFVGPRQLCVHSNTYTINNAITGTYQVVTHAGCVCNELVSLHNRHLVDRTVPEFDAAFFMKAARKVVRELHIPHVDPVSYHKVISAYSGAKRNAYLRALDNIQTYGFDKRWTYVKMFVKPDKFSADLGMTKPPRAIQYRSPEFNLLVARFLKPIEETFYNLQSPTGFRFVAKGLNNVERAELLRDVSSTYNNPVFVLVDHSAFDSTINETHLRATHKFYSKFNNNRNFLNLMKFQINNRGFSKHGIKYKVKGTRMSGDYDTALGNCFVNYVALRSWLRYSRVKGDIILDGDDSIIVVEKAQLQLLRRDHLRRCGFSSEIQVVEELTSVEFCQAKYLPTEPPRFARNPIRALSRLNISVKNYHGAGWARYQAGIGVCESMSNQGVPILYAIGQKLAALSKSPIFDTDQLYRIESVSTRLDAKVTDDVREAFYQAWGITPSEQRLIESEYTPALNVAASELLQAYFSLPSDAEKSIEVTRTPSL